MYAEKLKQFENVENLGGKAWKHAKACDLIYSAGIKTVRFTVFTIKLANI